MRNLSKWWLVLLLATASLGAAADDLRLVDAAKKNDTNAMRSLLKQGVAANTRAGDGSTALHWAAHWDALDAADLLIGARANVNAADDLGVTPLWVAASDASPAMVERLLKAGAQPNMALASGETPLMAAAHVGNVEVVKLLLAKGANPNAKENGRGQTALMWAAAQRHSKVVEALVEAGADVHARSGVYPLVVSVGSAADNVTQEDFEARGIFEIQQGGYTALLFASQQGDIDSARSLIAGGANVNDTAPIGASALVIAAHSGQGALGEFLLDKGADPNASGAGYAALHAAILRRDVGLVRALVAHGADANAPLLKATPSRRSSADYALGVPLIGGTPFWLAARFSEADIMRALAAGAANTAFVMKDGTTTLMAPMTNRGGGEDAAPSAAPIVTESMTLEAVKVAVDLGVNIDAVNNLGDTALHIAVSRGFNTIVQYLGDAGALLSVKNRRGQTPLAIAMARKADKVVEILHRLGAKE